MFKWFNSFQCLAAETIKQNVNAAKLSIKLHKAIKNVQLFILRSSIFYHIF